MEQAGVAGHLIAGEEPAEETDGHLENLHGDVLVEGEAIDDQRLRFLSVVLETHEQQRVERVDRRHEQRLAIPVARLFADRAQLVMAPGVLFVGLPRMEKLGADLRGHGRAVDRRRGEDRLRGEKEHGGGDA